MESYRSKPTRR